MTLDRARGHAALRRGRFSQAGAEYFLTICTEARCAGLTKPSIATGVLNEAGAMGADGTWTVRCAVVMPDHLHLLIVLGVRLSLDGAVQRLKARTAAELRASALAWGRGFFDRKLRVDDARLPVYRYIYLNPYRAGFLAPSDKWPFYYCRDDDWRWFSHLLANDRPYPEWLAR